jgi:Pvc16 N-terminal domain
MSTSRAIAAVSMTLRNLLEPSIGAELSGATVTVQPPDKIDITKNIVNLFLYRTSINAAFRNSDMPRQVRPNETGLPPLALDLHYLVTAYGDDLNDPSSHRLLGRAMQVLHDHPLLGADEIHAAIPDTYEQLERVRITPEDLSIDDMSKIWSGAQAKFRISAAYRVSVVLIESNRPAHAPLPVLRRGSEDRGVDAQSSLIPPYPALTGLRFATERVPSAQLGDVVTLRGHHLDGIDVTARFTHRRLAAPIDIGPLPGITTGGESELQVSLPNDAAPQAAWAAGNLSVSLIVTRAADPVNPTRTTNELSFALAPKILTRSPLSTAADTAFLLTITCSPEVLPEQRAVVLFGAVEVEADPHPAQTDTLTFQIPASSATAGDHFLRLRVDGVDSLIVDYTQTPLRFDPNQKVTIP